MNFSSLQENLKQGLSIVSHSLGGNVNLPILNNVMIKASDKKINLISTNLEVAITHAIRGQVNEDGEFTVDNKLINNYINLLPNKKVDIKKGETELVIECDNYKTKIKGQSSEDFPLIPQINKKGCYKININDFKKALSQVIFATANSETRLELSGVYFSFSEDGLVLAATDSYRLAERKLKIKAEFENKDNVEKKVIIPAKTIQEVLRILSNIKEVKDDLVELYIGDSQVLFIFGDTELISRVIEGQYPDYTQIIPQKSKTNITINKQELLRAVKVGSIFSKGGVDDINLDFPAEKNTVIVSSVSGVAGENVVELEASVRGDDNGVVVNYSYLLSGLSNIDTSNIKIEVVDNSTPCILRPENDDSYLYIIMPIKQ